MKLLAFDTSTETLSIAASAGGTAPVREITGPGGPRASAALIPAIEQVLAEAGLTLAGLDAIVFGRGPGSFTGLRTAAAVAQGLGFGSGVPVLALDTLQAVAEEAFLADGASHIVALLDARMGEVYAAAYERRGEAWITHQAPLLQRPQDVVVAPGWALAGNAIELPGWQLPPGTPHIPALPTARALLRLAPAALAGGGVHAAADALPLYIRDKVAQTTEERAADRARKEMRRGASAAESR